MDAKYVFYCVKKKVRVSLKQLQSTGLKVRGHWGNKKSVVITDIFLNVVKF